eukprot:2892400-Amphidinium_carterae.2
MLAAHQFFTRAVTSGYLNGSGERVMRNAMRGLFKFWPLDFHLHTVVVLQQCNPRPHRNFYLLTLTQR